MTRRYGALALCMIALVMVAASPARAEDPGLTVLDFLKVGVGARSAAMGDAYVAVAADASATYWNPAGLLGIERYDVQGTHNAWIQDLRQEFVGFGARFGRHAIGASFIGLFTSDIEARNEQGDFDGHFSFSDNAFAASYAFAVTPDLGFGGTIRYVSESIVGTVDGDFKLSGVAFDVGGTWHTPVQGLTVAGVLRNLGGQLSYNFSDASNFDLPSTVQVGGAFKHMDSKGGWINVAADVLSARGDDVSFRLGAEYAYRGQFLLGAGFKTGLDNEDVSFGVGYQNKIRFHYAFTPIASDLGSSNRITLGYSW